MRAQQMRRRSRRKLKVEGIHGVARRMMFGNIERLEIVVRRFDLIAFHDGKAKRKEDALDFFECLADQVRRPDWPNHARQREVDAFAGEGGCFRSGGYRLPKLLEAFFDVRSQFIEMTPDDGPKSGRRRLQPLLGNAIQRSGFSAQPSVSQ